MRIGIFLIAAIVLIVFGIIAAAGNGLLFSITWYIWFMASFLAYLTDLVVGWGYADGQWGRGPRQQGPIA